MNTQSNEINQTQIQGYDWAEGFKKSLPVAMGYLPAGIAFGVLAQVAGIPIWATIMLSVVLYAGAAQYACLPMLSAGLPIGSIATNIAAINLRHVFYGMPLLQYLPQNKIAKTYCLFALTDETFSVMTSLPNESRQSLILPVSIFNQGWWVLASAIGVLIGSALSDLVPHLDFALVCLFAILAYEQFQSIKRYFPIVIAVIALAIASLFTSHWLLLVAITICMMMILARGFFTPYSVKGDNNDQ
ncbi:putative branched chain amino acid efflux pump, LivE family, large subunit [Psychrobacter arcticus 273-4]|uniref:Putative branched chain amino acid efflux pump, LivE family, large subunit n=1 Tax=Psychrobacter arcticus (strain DSM 17307 / VKM B-2377 / 273-4) TaxID=259536 RepID=Q4FS78_PSYA2|nr:AzlC family ABC transporter permease [Psychrobacter arcticus]AAZ19130.1 putative branched chain amino acid efflux pump, LivE family, large subunit [Psychrobacter arcticus 273-4]